MSSQTEFHVTARRRVLYRVGNEIEKELAKPGAIRHHDDIRCEGKIHRDSLRFAKDERGLVNLVNQRHQLHWLAMNIETAFISSGQSQQALDEISHAPHFLESFLQRNHAFI